MAVCSRAGYLSRSFTTPPSDGKTGRPCGCASGRRTPAARYTRRGPTSRRPAPPRPATPAPSPQAQSRWSVVRSTSGMTRAWSFPSRASRSPRARRLRPRQTVSQADAQRVWMDGWGSGKPGTSTWLVMNNYPAGWVNEVTGVADYPSSARVEGLRQLHVHGRGVPRQAHRHPEHSGSRIPLLGLGSTRHGPAVAADVVPDLHAEAQQGDCLQGHRHRLERDRPHQGPLRQQEGYAEVRDHLQDHVLQGGQGPATGAGRRYGAAAGPRSARSAPTASASTARARSARRAPPGTCAWYPGDSWYWGAWTSVAKVTVR